MTQGCVLDINHGGECVVGRRISDVDRAANADATGAAKATNPKDAVGSRKARWFSYLPLRVLMGVGLAFLEGARKYGRHNYRLAGVRASVYVDACVCGHLMPWMEGEDIDPDTMELDAAGVPIPGTGLNHIDKAIASLFVLRDSMYEGNWVDDRPPSVADWPEFIKEYHRRAAAIIDRIPNAKDPFTIAHTQGESPSDARLAPLKESCVAYVFRGQHNFTTVSHPTRPKSGEEFNYCETCHGYEPFVPRSRA